MFGFHTGDSGIDFDLRTLDVNNPVSNKSFIKEVQYYAIAASCGVYIELFKVDNEL